MADSSLDDFFAKKDKSKKKQRTKGDGDDSLKQTKKAEKKKREQESGLGLGLGTSNILNKQEDDEWKDFEEEKKADYTGLRIQTLQIASKEDQDKESGDGDDDGDDEDGENRGKKDGASGPWAKNNSVVSEPQQAPSPQPETPKETAPAPKGPGKYVPPAQRHAAATMSTPHPMSNRRKKEAPNVNSEEDFPTLGGTPASGRAQNYDYIDQRKGVSLALENKFAALGD